MSKAQVSTSNWTIHKLYEDFYKNDNLLFNTEYQRSGVWGVKKKQKLIDSIVKQYNIGMIFLREKDDIYEVLDGQQRLKSIFDFMENFYSTSAQFTPELGEIYFDDLTHDRDRYSRFVAFDINVAIVKNADDETTADIFLRLQEGMPLNTAEKLNAMRGQFRNIILDISKHHFIKNTGINDHRFAHRLLTAQITTLENNSNFDLMIFSDIRFDNLKDMYEKYAFKEPKGATSRVKRYLNFLDKSFGNKASIINKRGDFIPIYLLSSYINKKYVTDGIKEDFLDFTIDFLSKVESTKINDEKISNLDKPYQDFKQWRSRGSTSSKSFIKRFDIILGKFLEYCPNIQLKDPKRTFDYGQKLAIYYRDNNVCQICQKDLSFNESEFDHIKSWSKGGKTIVSNGQLLCQTCNRQKGNN